LQRLCEEISYHFARRTIFDAHLLVLDAIGYEELADVNVASAFATRATTVLLK
jgi:hypothetical protein